MKLLAWTKTWEGYGTAIGVDTPYVDFDTEVGGISPILRAPRDPLLRRQIPEARTAEASDADGDAATDPEYDDPALNVLASILSIVGAEGLPPFLPSGMVTGLGRPKVHEMHLQEKGPLPEFLRPECKTPLPEEMCIPENAVIVGVVDLGIALGHRRTQLLSGKTRILSSWQQSADRSRCSRDNDQHYLPFGREIYAGDINKKLNSDFRPLDEERFNRETQTEDYRSLFGQRELGQRASHGMHILDLAGGLDPEIECGLADQVRLMVTNFPARALVGHSAAFLEYFAVYAIWRQIRLADAIWSRNNEGKKAPSTKGYRMVINLSFGKQASARDGNDLIAKAMELINCSRKDYHPVVLSLPAGNENLEQGNSNFILAGGAGETIEWRIPPGDQSANFVEVWAQPVQGVANQALEIELIMPSGQSSNLSQGTSRSASSLYVQLADDALGTFSERGPLVARIYSDHINDVGTARQPSWSQHQSDRENHADMNVNEYRQRYVVAVKQTLIYEKDDRGNRVETAPAGVWKIRVRNNSNSALRVELNVQTDQSENPVTAVNQRSYFEHSEYRRFDETGRKIDTYNYPRKPNVPKSLDSSNVVRRHGTLNAVGISQSTATVAGHRATDGRPEPYSSTGQVMPPASKRKRREEPSASFPSRDGAAHFGVLASGARDGSAVALQGTSFSAAMATRHLWQIMLNTVGLVPPAAVVELEKNAETAEACMAFGGAIARPKSGRGRFPHPQQATLLKRRNLSSRLGNE
jgi:hypothetical protein